MTLRDKIASTEAAIEKIKNSQEYQVGNSKVAYAQISDLRRELTRLLALIRVEADLDLDETTVTLKYRGTNRATVSFS